MTTKLYPVLFEVPDETNTADPKKRTAVLSELARKALQMSADRSNLVLKNLAKGEKGEPLPENGVHWSLTHKPGWVGAVASKNPVGIDLERIKPIRDGMFTKVASESDWDLVGGKSQTAFFQLWTAKEAVVKAEGVGFSGFSRCRVVEPCELGRLIMAFDQRLYYITYKQFDGHIAAVTSRPEQVDWHITELR